MAAVRGLTYGPDMATHDLDRTHIPVVIVGAGPAGLTTALLLNQQQVPSLVVERRSAVSPLPRATGVNVRTMEIFRALGIADEIVAKSPDSRGMDFMLVMDWLGGPILEKLPYPSAVDASSPGAPSPAGYQFCSQDVLEPILVDAVTRSRYAEVSHGTQLLGFAQDAEGVAVRLHNQSTGRTHQLRCDYLVGADGAGSLVRRLLGIEMHGHDRLTHDLNIVFEAELAAAVRGRKALLHRVVNPTLGSGLFRNLDGKGRRWTAFTNWFDDPTPQRCAQVIRRYAHDDDLDVHVTAVGEWGRATLLADRFRSDRVFLVGDAAHRLVPHGGLGMNTAIQSAHNLAWKLAAVHRGWADPQLLDSYEFERHDAGARTVELSYRLFTGPVRQSSDVLGHVLGTAYETGALIPDGSAPPAPANPVAEYVPVARPGHRAPHFWLKMNGTRVSTLDLFGRAFVLLSASEAWISPARRITNRVDVPLDAHLIRDREWALVYGVGERGAVLVRPDGYVAWRTTDEQPSRDTVVADVLREILCRAPAPASR